MMWLFLSVHVHVPQWRKNKSENEVDNIFYEFTGQSATQVASYTIFVVDVY